MTDPAAYEAKYAGTPKWAAELATVAELLGGVPRGSWVLDCPVGSGRFLPLYSELGLFYHGVDIDPAMIAAAMARREGDETCLGGGSLLVGSLFDWLPCADIAVCVRFLGDWLAPTKFEQALATLRRCAPAIICGLRYGGRDGPPGKYWPISRERFAEALMPYRIERSIPLDGQDYWMHLCR